MFTVFNRFSWKQTLSLNLGVLVLTGGILALSSVQQPTRTVSQASLPQPSPTPIPAYPTGLPRITTVEPFFAKPGDALRLKGENFGQAQWQSLLTFGSLPLSPEHVLSWNDTQIDFILPQPATFASPLFLTVNGHTTKSDFISLYHSNQDPALKLDSLAQTQQLSLLNLNQPATLILTLKNLTPPTLLLKPEKTVPLAEKVIYQFPLSSTTTTLPLLQSETIEIVHALLLDQNHHPLPLYLKP